ncbi:P-loop containing nucleoside triphosphate hydrolase protein [Rhizophagus irregularis]|nr:P-loop containing nucleoside triphosphate hydrolase protein [Rhizophagus irregularis]
MSDRNYERQKSQEFSKKNKYVPKTVDSTLREALRRRGEKFESDIKDKLNNVVDCRNVSPYEAKNMLIKIEVGQTLYQMKFIVPEEFYEKMGIKDIKLKPFVPDFIEVKEEDGEKKLMVYDAKASKTAQDTHLFQVASYAYLLNFVVQKICGLSISRTGGIYLLPFQLYKFRVDSLFSKIDEFFRKELPNILIKETVPWHYNLRCKTCEFVDACRIEAEGSIAMIPYLPLKKAEELKSFIPERKSGDDVDIEDLSNYFNKLNIEDENAKSSDKAIINKRIKQIIKYDEKSKSSPYFKAIETKKAQIIFFTNKSLFNIIKFIGIATENFPKTTDHNLLIAMSLDPFLSRPFGWAICLYSSDGKVISNFRRSGSSLKDNESLKSFVSLMDKFVTTLEKIFEYLANLKSKACVFIFSEQEKKTLHDALLKIISMDEDNISSATQHIAVRCLYNLFDNSSFLLASGNNNSDNNTEFPNELREFPRLFVLETAIRANIAIHVPGFYRFIDIWEQLVKPKLKDEKLLNSLEQHIKDIDLEDIYARWVSSQSSISEINAAQLLKVDFGIAVISSYYELLNESTNDVDLKLLFTPPVFTFTEIKAFENNYLGKLYFFKQFEAITECARTRSSRINDLMQGETVYGIRLKFKEFTNMKKDVAKFVILSNQKEVSVLEPNSTFKDFIVVKDNPEDVLKAIHFPDMKYRDKYSYPLSVVCIKEVENQDPQTQIIYLKGSFMEELIENETYRLYKRYFNFNLDKILTILTEIDEQDDNKSIFLNLLKDPNAWGSSLIEEHFGEVENTALKLQDSFSMSPSQKEISDKLLLGRRLQIIWGPPGSGKTHFLALFTTWYLSTVKTSNYIVGVTAFTRAAIENLLDRISTVQKKHHKINDFSIIYLVNDLNKPSTGTKYKVEDLPNINDIGIPGKPIVIGGTVWDWFKVRKKWKSDWAGCDIMIIDEGSQLLVSDASIPIECINPYTGKLIVAGDHKQLGPIIQNTYPVFPPDHPLIFGSIQQCLMRKSDGSVFNEKAFFLKKGQKHDFGPLTLQLRENWRMNDELNGFFQKIYSDDYISKNPNLKLAFDNSKLDHIKNPLIQRILSPDPAITLVKLSLDKNIDSASSLLSTKFLQIEADAVAKIASEFCDTLKISQGEMKKPSLFIVAPYHRQRRAIQSRLVKYLNDQFINLQINTIEKMQGQEADLVISCFGFISLSEIPQETEFLFNINRWNVAISRARCKVIIVTTNEMLHHKNIEIFANEKTKKGWAFLSMIEKWVQDKYNEVDEEERMKNKNIIEWL